MAQSMAFGKTLSLPYEEAVEQVKGALKSQGFGVLTEIDVRKTLRERLGVEFRRYLILGVCNPPLAYQALTTDLNVGLLLPCNVVVYEEGSGSVVRVMDPEVALSVAGTPALGALAADAKQRLTRAVDSLPD